MSTSMQLMREQIGSGEEVQHDVGSGEVRRQLRVALSWRWRDGLAAADAADIKMDVDAGRFMVTQSYISCCEVDVCV